MNRRRRFFFAVSIAAVVLTFAPIALAGKGGHGGGTGGTGNTGGYTLTLSPGGPFVFGESVYATTNVPVTTPGRSASDPAPPGPAARRTARSPSST
jgi:hypothetical protein